MKTYVYICSLFNRHCPEEDDCGGCGEVFSTYEKALEYVNLHDPKNSEGIRDSDMGLIIIKCELDPEIIPPTDFSDVTDDFDVTGWEDYITRIDNDDF